METNRKLTAVFVIAALVIIGLIILYLVHAPTNQEQNPSGGPQQAAQNGAASTIQATFACDGGKSIQATFVNATTATTTGNSVQLMLSDGRQMSLPQVISADGARYANADESFVFWNVGNGATVYENNKPTFTNCTTQPQR